MVNNECDLQSNNLSPTKSARKVRFPSNEKIVSEYIEPPNPWRNFIPYSRAEIYRAYQLACKKLQIWPLQEVLNQIKALPPNHVKRYSKLYLKDAKLYYKDVEALEELLKRVQYQTIDLENALKYDEASSNLLETIEYYESCVHLVLRNNRDAYVQTWKALCHIVRKDQLEVFKGTLELQMASFLETLDCSNTNLMLLSFVPFTRSLRFNHSLRTLNLTLCSMNGKSFHFLVNALKGNHTLRTLIIQSNRLNYRDMLVLKELLNNAQQPNISNSTNESPLTQQLNGFACANMTAFDQTNIPPSINKSRITNLDISCNPIGDTGFKELCIGLMLQISHQNSVLKQVPFKPSPSSEDTTTTSTDSSIGSLCSLNNIDSLNNGPENKSPSSSTSSSSSNSDEFYESAMLTLKLKSENALQQDNTKNQNLSHVVPENIVVKRLNFDENIETSNLLPLTNNGTLNNNIETKDKNNCKSHDKDDYIQTLHDIESQQRSTLCQNNSKNEIDCLDTKTPPYLLNHDTFYLNAANKEENTPQSKKKSKKHHKKKKFTKAEKKACIKQLVETIIQDEEIMTCGLDDGFPNALTEDLMFQQGGLYVNHPLSTVEMDNFPSPTKSNSRKVYFENHIAGQSLLTHSLCSNSPPTLYCIKYLNLTRCQLQTKAMIYLIPILSHPLCQLEVLNLSLNGIQDQGLALLKSALCKNRSLKKLILHECFITDEGAITMAEVIGASTTPSVGNFHHDSIIKNGNGGVIATNGGNSNLNYDFETYSNILEYHNTSHDPNTVHSSKNLPSSLNYLDLQYSTSPRVENVDIVPVSYSNLSANKDSIINSNENSSLLNNNSIKPCQSDPSFESENTLLTLTTGGRMAHLDLRHNYIGLAGIMALAKALKFNYSLLYLGLHARFNRNNSNNSFIVGNTITAPKSNIGSNGLSTIISHSSSINGDTEAKINISPSKIGGDQNKNGFGFAQIFHPHNNITSKSNENNGTKSKVIVSMDYINGDIDCNQNKSDEHIIDQSLRKVSMEMPHKAVVNGNLNYESSNTKKSIDKSQKAVFNPFLFGKKLPDSKSPNKETIPPPSSNVLDENLLLSYYMDEIENYCLRNRSKIL